MKTNREIASKEDVIKIHSLISHQVSSPELLHTRNTRKEITDWTVEGIKEYKRNIGAMNKKLYESTNYEEFAKAVQSAQKVVTIKGRGKGQR